MCFLCFFPFLHRCVVGVNSVTLCVFGVDSKIGGFFLSVILHGFGSRSPDLFLLSILISICFAIVVSF